MYEQLDPKVRDKFQSKCVVYIHNYPPKKTYFSEPLLMKNLNFAVFMGRYSLIKNDTIITYGKTLTYECPFGAGMIILMNNSVDNENEIIFENSTFHIMLLSNMEVEY